MSELILYQTEDGKVQVKLRAEDGSVWLSQAEMAELFSTTVPNANIHIRNILKEGEQDADSVIKESLITAADGKRYRTKLYRLEMILAVGYRVRHTRHAISPVGNDLSRRIPDQRLRHGRRTPQEPRRLGSL